MNKKKTIIILVIGILIVIILSIGVTYSYMKPKTDKTNNQTEIGINNCANLTLKEKNKTINLTNMYPMEEEMALQKDAYEFTISNTCEEYEGFSLYLTTLNGNGIEDSNIRYAITDLGNNVLISDVLSKRPNGISDFSEEELKQLDTEINGTHKNIYKIYGSTISINRNNKYKLYLWLDEKAGNDTMGKSFTVGLTTKLSEEEKNYVKDLSGNNYDGVMKNGALIKLDEEGRQGLYFDGEDDYVDIVDLPETINWDGGFTVEIEAKWLKINSWSRIFDFGNGEYDDNIFLANYGLTNNLNFDSRYGTESSRGSTTLVDSIVLNEHQKFKVEVIKNSDSYTHNIYKDNNLGLSRTYNVTNYVKNIDRTSNYLGKSNWKADKYFNGYIYYLKFTDANNNVILEYNFTNETIEDLSGNGNYGVFHNIASWDEDGITTSDDNGLGYVDCGLYRYNFGNQISTVIRLKINKLNGLNHYFGNWDGAGFGFTSNPKFQFWLLSEKVGDYTILTSNEDTQINKWYTLVATYDNQKLKIYINGTLDTSVDVSGNIRISPTIFAVGANPNGLSHTAGHSYNVTSDALLFKRALLEEEIERDYANEINPTNKQDLLLWYKF